MADASSCPHVLAPTFGHPRTNAYVADAPTVTVCSSWKELPIAVTTVAGRGAFRAAETRRPIARRLDRGEAARFDVAAVRRGPRAARGLPRDIAAFSQSSAAELAELLATIHDPAILRGRGVRSSDRARAEPTRGAPDLWARMDAHSLPEVAMPNRHDFAMPAEEWNHGSLRLQGYPKPPQ